MPKPSTLKISRSSRECLINSLERMKSYIFQNADSMSVVDFDTRLSLLESNFQKFCDIQADIVQVYDKEIEF